MALTDESGVNVSMPVAPMGYPYLTHNPFGNDELVGSIFDVGGQEFNLVLLIDLSILREITHLGMSVLDLASALGNQLSGIQNAVTNGFSNAEVAACNRALDNLNRSFDSQTAITSALYGVNNSLQNCCCENRAGLADLKYTVATEACADRNAVSNALRDVLAANTASTQRILDQLCNDKIDQKNDTIAQLRQELIFARGQASQDVQTARILAGQTAEVDALYDRLNNCPVGTVPVYGRQPIFTCNNNGCNCGM